MYLSNCREKTRFLPMRKQSGFAIAKTKAQISCAVTAQLISAFASLQG